MDDQEYTKTLTSIRRIGELCNDKVDIKLPRMCVIGDQSSGKSSLLETLTNVKFPVAAGICTKCPILVECKRNTALSTNKYYINEPTPGLMYGVTDTFQKKEIDETKLSEKIKELQTIFTNGKKISEKEISIFVEGPTQMDIILIDLPGLIHNGDGKTEVRSLIEKYIELETTLILICSEANADEETQEAMELAKKYDECSIRTIRILTKYDSFSSPENNTRANMLVTNEQHHPLGTHRVICRHSGTAEYNEATEQKFFNKIGVDIDNHTGISNLKVRLPKIFAKLIKENIPTLKEDIKVQLAANKKILNEIGHEQPSHSEIIVKAKEFLLSNNLEEIITPVYLKFKNEVRMTKDQLTKEWVREHYTINVFEPPFFQGATTFKRCIDIIATNWWKPLLMKYLNDIKDVLEHMIDADLMATKCPKQFIKTIQYLVENEFQQYIENLIIDSDIVLNDERVFGTNNHYLTSKYKEQLAIPDECVKEFIDSLTERDFYLKSDNTVRVETLSEIKESIEKKLNIVLKNNQEAFLKEPVEEQQLIRIYYGIKANFDVEFKTFTDEIHKKTRLCIIDRWIYWLNTLLTNPKLIECASEDTEITNKRVNVIHKIDILNRSLQEITTNYF